jgi:tetratricopeptide (TPR) repeat protein
LAYAAFAALGIAALTLAVYARAFGHEFLNWDDWDYVLGNGLVTGRHWGALLRAIVSDNFHPLSLLSLALDVRTPLSPGPFLVGNVVLHALDTLLAFALAWRLSSGRIRVAAFVALLFGLHPMHVESVAWISERKDVLYALFFLAAAIAYDRYLERRGLSWLAFAFGMFLLSCLSKGMAVSFPVVMILLDFWRGRPLRGNRVLLEKLPFFAVALVVGAIAVNVQAGGDVHGLLQRMPGSSPALVPAGVLTPLEHILLPTYGHLLYVTRFFAPLGLCAFHPYPTGAELHAPLFLLSPVFFVGTLVVAAWDVRRTRLVAFGVGWYLATLALVLQWIPVGGAFMAERYTYLPYVGLAFLCAMALDRLLATRARLGFTVWCLSALLAGGYALETARQVDTWRNSVTLWSRVIAVYPRCAVAYEFRGNALHLEARLEDALADLVRARALGDRRSDLFEELGTTYGALGRLDSATVLLGEAIRRDPANESARVNRAITYLRLSSPGEAFADLDCALALAPNDRANLLGLRGYAHLMLGEYPAASADLDRAIAAGDRRAENYSHRAQARLRLGDRAGAASDLRAALHREPANAALRTELLSLGETP